MSTTDILIIGAGPTGLTLALELTAQNIPFRIIDSSPTRSDKSKALVLQPRTLEYVTFTFSSIFSPLTSSCRLLRRHGIVDRFVQKGRFNPGVRIFARKQFVFEVNLLDLGFDDTEFQSPLMISQAEIERELEAAFATSVERGVQVCQLEENQGLITAEIKHSDGKSEEIKARYVVGCDGSHSFVRKTMDLPFMGAVYPQDFILADVHMTWPHPDMLSIFMGAYGFVGVFTLPNFIYRLICTRPSHLGAEEEPTIDDFRESLRQLVPGEVEIRDEIWITRFRLSHRCVDSYRKGRMFLAGDAAHIHSPAGGQGMNTGMQDAINLGWKLARVLREEKPDSYLDSYNEERRRIGTNLLARTDRMFEIMSTTNPLWLFVRNWILPWTIPWAMGNRERRAARFRFVSQLGIRYRRSSIVGTGSGFEGRLRGGDRVPDGIIKYGDEEQRLHELLVGPSYHLLLFSGTELEDKKALKDAATDLSESPDGSTTKVHQIANGATAPVTDGVLVDTGGNLHNLFGFLQAGYVLVRPDGYIEHVGLVTQVNELKRWLK